MSDSYIVAGLMSGTSLDGLDVAVCRFEKKTSWSFEIIAAKTFEYSSEWKSKLSTAHQLRGLDLALLHTDLGSLHGKITREFLDDQKLNPDFIASHGHTVFHQPDKGMTLQIGSAPHIAAATKLPVIADFRTADVAFGGQGAPLVPIGDLLLFGEFALCLNLGGIANISIKSREQNSIIAYDVCPCNMVLNDLVKTLGLEYDHGGELASSGNIHDNLLADLNSLNFYQQSPPKSLGKEFFDAEIAPLLQKHALSVQDSLRTFVEHVAVQIGNSTINHGDKKMLVTGGGALNSFLIERISVLSKSKIVVPDLNLIQFKEALIFALLGVLRMRGDVNTLANVTGASQDSCGGSVYSPVV